MIMSSGPTVIGRIPAVIATRAMGLKRGVYRAAGKGSSSRGSATDISATSNPPDFIECQMSGDTCFGDWSTMVLVHDLQSELHQRRYPHLERRPPMNTTIKLLALSVTIVGLALVTAAAVSRGPAAVSTDSSVTLSGASGGSPSKAVKPAVAPAPAVVAPAAAPADQEFKSGHVPYRAPNAAVPEDQRAPTGDATCPGTQPCGP